MESLHAVTHRFPTERILLVGPCPPSMAAAVRALATRPNVDWRPPVPYAELPEVLREVEVLLLPRTSPPAAEASDPLKFYDYLATGRPIVATPLPGAAPLPAGAVYWGASGAPFADATHSALAEHRTHPRGAAAPGRIAVTGHSCKTRAQKILPPPACLHGPTERCSSSRRVVVQRRQASFRSLERLSGAHAVHVGAGALEALQRAVPRGRRPIPVHLVGALGRIGQ